MLGSTGYVGIDGVCWDCQAMLGLTGMLGLMEYNVTLGLMEHVGIDGIIFKVSVCCNSSNIMYKNSQFHQICFRISSNSTKEFCQQNLWDSKGIS